MKMKLKKSLICAFTLAIASAASSAMAIIEKESMEIAAQNGFIDIEVSGNTLILTGFVQNDQSRELAEEAAERSGYDVINYLMVSTGGGVGFF